MDPQGKIKFVGWALALLWGMAAFANALRFTSILRNAMTTDRLSAALPAFIFLAIATALTLLAALFAHRFQAQKSGSRRFAQVSLGLLVAAALFVVGFSKLKIGLMGIAMLSPWLALHGAAFYLVWKHPNRFP